MFDAAWYLAGLLGGVAGLLVTLGLHEFGHAVPILLAGSSAHVKIGNDTGRTVEFGPVTVTVGFQGVVKTIQYGRCDSREDLSTVALALCIAGGPIATIAVIAILALVLTEIGTSGPLAYAVEIVFYGELVRAAMTILPMTYRWEPYTGMESDGKRFLRLVRS